MQNSRLNKLRTVLYVLILFFTVFSAVFASFEAGHVCAEENCPICFLIYVVKTNLEILVLIIAAFKIIYPFYKSEKSAFSSIKYTFNSNTLFSLKTRLND